MGEDLSVDSIGASDIYRDIYRRQREILRSFSLIFRSFFAHLSLFFRSSFGRLKPAVPATIACCCEPRISDMATVRVLGECVHIMMLATYPGDCKQETKNDNRKFNEKHILT
jgi:hypothetical protein